MLNFPNHALRRRLSTWVARITAVAGTSFTGPKLTLTKSSFHLWLNFYYC